MTQVAKTRTLTGIAIALGIAVSFLLRELSVYIFDFVILGIVVLAAREVMMARKLRDDGLTPIYIYVYILLAYAMFLLGLICDPQFSLVLHLLMQFVLFLVFILYCYFMYFVDEEYTKKQLLKKISPSRAYYNVALSYLKVAIYPVLLLMFFIPLNHVSEFASLPETGSASLLALFGITLVIVVSCATDTFAYIVGCTLRGPKLCPKISPKKTWSGAIGGLFGGIVGGLLVLLLFSLNSGFDNFVFAKLGSGILAIVLIMIVSIIGSVLTQVGDIYASLLKRKCGIKDFEKYLPGHGGVMDRLDGISFNLVFITIIIYILAFL